MDYCSTCRRHLNGALMCPGCGAYAPDIAPLADGTPAPAAGTVAAARQVPSQVWNDADSDTEASSAPPTEDPYDGPDAPSPAPAGRAARRRQRERWKKTQRKALVATAVALVGGGLTVASLNRQTPDRTQAASAPDREVMGMAEEEATEPTPVASPLADTRRTERTSSGVRSSTAHTTGTTNTPHGQRAATPQATPANPATPANQQYSVTIPVTKGAAAAKAHAQAATTPVSDATNTGAKTPVTPAPAPPATDNSSTDSGTNTGPGTSGSGTSGTDPSSATPAPSESSSSPSSPGLCLLGLVCVQ
ncbi:hypothetical protein ADL01_17775 [Streptomyces sp. NRRL WC-3618]|uniref:SCO2400 family protein n=1 Tax=Streptomyces sp. NRRL WC-3618 TaxID=1519490 RepID=UPI0006ADF6FE|nr:hypothetical protein [Streptomyces sp. NRRL WC-3618]KOV74480.1 hypothetical protein ADL01_17775 [Streptomyces sp. NRRL WC-3618]